MAGHTPGPWDVEDPMEDSLHDVLSEAREAVEERFDAVPVWGA